jgi:hypothetical protein
VRKILTRLKTIPEPVLRRCLRTRIRPLPLALSEPGVDAALDEHPAGKALLAELKTRAAALLSAPDAMSAVQALAAAVEQAWKLDGRAVLAHLRHLPCCRWALARAE